jgi:hypothetical protein
MYTGMERHIVFSKLRRREFPEAWINGVAKAFPSLQTMLMSMLSPKSSERPSADSVASHMESLLSEFTVLSLDKSHSERGATLLRVEADASDGILTRTIQLIRDAAPHVKIEQYGLRGSGESKAIMEFALSNTKQDGGLANILDGMVACKDIKLARQISSNLHLSS